MIPKVAQIGIRVCHVLRMCSIFFLLKVTQINAQYLDDRQDSWCHLESCRVKGLRPDVDPLYNMVRCQNCHVRWQTRWHDGGGVIGLSRHEQEITVIITVAPHIDNLTKHPYRTKTWTFKFDFSFHKKFKMGFSVNVIYHFFLTTILEVNQKTSCTSYSTIKKYWVYSQFLMKRCKLVGSHVSGRGWRFSSGEAIYSLSLARQGRPARLHHHRLQIHKYKNTNTQIHKHKNTNTLRALSHLHGKADHWGCIITDCKPILYV